MSSSDEEDYEEEMPYYGANVWNIQPYQFEPRRSGSTPPPQAPDSESDDMWGYSYDSVSTGEESNCEEEMAEVDEGAMITTFKVQQYDYEETGNCRDLLLELNSRREEKFLTDVTIVVEDKKFACHRNILAASSPYFKALFVHDPAKRSHEEITVCNIPANGFDLVLQFIYTGKLRINLENVLDILETADFLQFRRIVEKCSDILIQNISLENCLLLKALGAAHMCKALCSSARQYALTHFQKVGDTTEFLDLPHDDLTELLTDIRIVISDEKKLMHSLLKWVRHDCEHRVGHLEKLLSLVANVQVSSQFLRDSVLEFPFLSDMLDTEVCCDGEQMISMHQAFKQTKAPVDAKRASEVVVVMPRDPDVALAQDGDPVDDPAAIWYFHPLGNKWQVLTKLPFKNRRLYSMSVLNNCMYIAGGEDKDAVATAEVTKYDIQTNSWSTSPPLLTSRSNHSSVSMLGCLYVVGGKGRQKQDPNTAEEFNPLTQQWTLLPSLLGVEGIGRFTLVPLGEKLYVLGGSSRTKIPGTNNARFHIVPKQSKEAQYFDFNSKSWHPADKLYAYLISHNVSTEKGNCLPYQGLLLIIDENTSGRKMKVFNPVTEEFHNFIHRQGPHRCCSYVICKDTLFCLGGVVVGRVTPHNLVHSRSLVDPHGAWQLLPALPHYLSDHGAVTMFKELDGESDEQDCCNTKL